MWNPLGESLARWRQAGLIDAATSDRILAFEASQSSPARLRWPVITALAAGGLMLTAGALLFVAAHWAYLAPAARMAILLAGLAAAHAGGVATSERFPALAITLHAVGTGMLGATLFLAGQTWHLEANWPQGFLLWAIGAWAGYLLLASWPQLLFAALLTPAWLVAEWADRLGALREPNAVIPTSGLLLLALVYLLADGGDQRSADRTALAILGAIALIPLAILTVLLVGDLHVGSNAAVPPGGRLMWWGVALGGPLLVAARLRGREAWIAVIGLLWVVAGVNLGRHPGVLAYLWAAFGAIGVTATGVHDRSRRCINLGLASFAITIVIFYFSSVLDKLGRATSLLTGGVLFLLLGWGLESLRRRLVTRTSGPEGN
jgi:uncharacterized membrane protein